MANKKYWMLGVVLLLIVVIAVVLIMLNNMKAEAASKAFADANEQQGALSEWWNDVSPFANPTGLTFYGLPDQSVCDNANKTGGFCISTGSILGFFGIK